MAVLTRRQQRLGDLKKEMEDEEAKKAHKAKASKGEVPRQASVLQKIHGLHLEGPVCPM